MVNHGVSNSSLIRLARRAGVKSVSRDFYKYTSTELEQIVKEIVDTAVDVRDGRNTKTLLAEDAYEAMRLHGYNVCESSELGTKTAYT